MSEDRDPGAPPQPPVEDDPPRGTDRGDRLHTFHGERLEVTWSRRRCIHAAACVMNMPDVFHPGRRPWVIVDEGAADSVARVVTRCPTGALQFQRSDGGAPEAVPTANTVRVAPHGPLYVHGDVVVQDESGTRRLTDTRVALCRCGGSANGPLCDSTHNAAGFMEPGSLGTPPADRPTAGDGTALHVRPERDGPLHLEGSFTLIGADRVSVQVSGVNLCRCGRSANKPFCDGSHRRRS